jgi:predicted helicase
MIMACGTGKTLTALWMAEKLESKRTLVLLPSLLLLSKTLADWVAHGNEPFAYLPVCSDETVSRGADMVMSSTSDLAFPSTTDAGEIASFLRKRGTRVIFSTYQSSPKIAEAFKQSKVPGFDLVIADEAHRCAGKVASEYGTVLDNDAIPAKKRLFLTAIRWVVGSLPRGQLTIKKD